MSRKPQKRPPVCERCGHEAAEHLLANATNGISIGEFILICPTAVYKAEGFLSSGAERES
jgi:hypothetical protein